MKKLILRWLFGTSNVDSYMKLLRENMNVLNKDLEHCCECIELINDHKRTLEREKSELDLIRKLIRVCENHGIDVDEEIKHTQLYNNNGENANETVD